MWVAYVLSLWMVNISLLFSFICEIPHWWQIGKEFASHMEEWVFESWT